MKAEREETLYCPHGSLRGECTVCDDLEYLKQKTGQVERHLSQISVEVEKRGCFLVAVIAFLMIITVLLAAILGNIVGVR